MLSRENRMILFSMFVLLPASILAFWPLDRWLDLPSWASAAIPIAVCLLAPPLYLWFSDGDRGGK